jgi:hypothetical protein
MNIPKFELTKGFDVSNAPSTNLSGGSVDELLSAGLTPNLVITSWGMRGALQPGILAGLQGQTECMGPNSPELPVSPDKSLISGLVPQVYPSQAGRRS